MQWGSLAYHQQSLRNLGKAMLQTRRLCAVKVDTLGREVFIRRSVEVGDDGWLKHGDEVAVAKGGSITLTIDPNAEQTDSVFPVSYSGLLGVLSQACMSLSDCVQNQWLLTA